jgi:hypothetical protein
MSGDKAGVKLSRDMAAEDALPLTFTAALEAVTAVDWCRTWAAGRTIMLRRTSNRVKEVVDKKRMPVLFRLNRSFWDDTRNGTEKVKCQFVLRQLPLMTAFGASSAHSSCRAVVWKDKMQRGLQKFWRSAQRWRTLISVAIQISEQPGQRGLQECWDSTGSWCTSISAAKKWDLPGITITSAILGQRALQECWRSAQR